jgi:hypothetical protein
MADASIIKKLDQLIVMGEMVSRNAARLKKELEGGVSTPPKRSGSIPSEKQLKTIATRRKQFIKSKVAC